MKLWGGRFSKNASKLLDEFNNSISFDYILYKYDILGSTAHVKMLNKIGLIETTEMEQIIAGLESIQKDIESDNFEFKIEDEDIHMSIEKELINRVGNVGKKLHTARSRNDQITLDMKLYSKDKIKEIKFKLKDLMETLTSLSEENLDTYMPGYTHLQGAQIISLAFYLQAYFQKFKRDVERLEDIEKRVNIMPLGAGALAGVNYKTDRQFVCDELGFSKVTENALDTVSDRDYILEILNAISLISLHLSRINEEIIIYASQEYKFVDIDDAFSTGSSIMPQKKNPDVSELIRGKSGEAFGNLMALLTTMKGLPLAYNKDMQDDKKYLFNSVDMILASIEIFNEMLKTMKFNKENMKNACFNGFLQATDIADYLVMKGLEFRDAHEVVGTIVGDLDNAGQKFQDLDFEAFKKYSDLFEEDIFEILEIDYSLNMKQSYGSTSNASLVTMLKNAKNVLKNIKN